jgi:hypothetical protein
MTLLNKNPGPKDLALPLPPGRGLHKVLCLSKVLWSIGVVEKFDYSFL